MATKNSKCLAIDTDLIQAASGRDEYSVVSNEESQLYRRFMLEVLKLGHSVIVTPEIMKEWREHQVLDKPFVPKTQSWYIQMTRRGLIKIHEEDATRPELRDTIFTLVEKNAIDAVRKDMRWIEAALLADKRVVSKESRSFSHFRRAAKSVDEIKAIIWINPRLIREDSIFWLREGAPTDEHRMLGYVTKDT